MVGLVVLAVLVAGAGATFLRAALAVACAKLGSEAVYEAGARSSLGVGGEGERKSACACCALPLPVPVPLASPLPCPGIEEGKEDRGGDSARAPALAPGQSPPGTNLHCRCPAPAP